LSIGVSGAVLIGNSEPSMRSCGVPVVTCRSEALLDDRAQQLM
jgi:hypothetical protein